MCLRRETLSALLGVVALSLAGCPLLDREIRGTASPARVSDQSVRATGFTQRRMEKQVSADTITLGGEKRDLTLTNWITEYTKWPTGAKDITVNFLIFTTPIIRAAGKPINPFDHVDEPIFVRKLVENSELDGTGSLDQKGVTSVEILRDTVEISLYETVSYVAGRRASIDLYFGKQTNAGEMADAGDIIAFFGSHLTRIEERGNIYRLAEGIEHPVDA